MGTERSYDENSTKNNGIRLRIHHFHPSTVDCDSNAAVSLKPFSMSNDNFKEDYQLLRL